MSNRKFLTNKTVIPYSQIVGAPNTDGFVQGLVAGTNITIDNSDPRHPKISSSGGGGGSGGQVDSVVAGSGISVDSSDPVNPTITNTAPAVLPLTTKGDIYTHDGTGPIRFPAGADGQVVGYDSSTATGLKAVTPSGGGGSAKWLHVYRSTNFTTSSGTGYQQIPFDAIEVDEDSIWDSVNNRAVIKTAGIYLISFQRNGPSGFLEPRIFINGGLMSIPGVAGNQYYAITHLFRRLASGDVVTAHVYKTGAYAFGTNGISGGLTIMGPM